MDEIKKMIRFDYINCISIGGKYAFVFAALCIALCLLGAAPIACGFFLVTPLALFSPIETVRKGDFMKIYGLLPVKRESVIKALFAEVIIPQIIGGLMAEIGLLISSIIGKSGILPNFIQEHVYVEMIDGMKNLGIEYSNWYVLTAAGLTVITVIITLFYGIKEIKGDILAIIACVPFMIIMSILFLLYIAFLDRNVIPLPQDIIPTAPALMALIVIILFAIFITFGWLMCRLTIKLTADKEL